MLDTDTRQGFQGLLDDAKESGQKLKAAKQWEEYGTLKKYLIYRELKREIGFLSSLIDEENCLELFRIRAAERQTSGGAFIPITFVPLSVTNQLYFDIACLLFDNPATETLIEILVPQTTKQLIIEPGFYLNENNTIDKTKPKLMTRCSTNLSFVDCEPAPNPFATLLFDDDLVFDVSDIASFPLELQAQLYEFLISNHPNLADKLYQHNSFFQQLKKDIHTYRSGGKIVKRLIEELIESFESSGEHQGGGIYASRAVETAIIYFQNYCKRFPDDIYKKIMALSKTKKETIDWVVNTHLLEHGECVEVAKIYLDEILHHHKNNKLLQEFAGDQETIKDLVKLYGQGSINSHYQIDKEKQNFPFPMYYLCKVIENSSDQTIISDLWTLPEDVCAKTIELLEVVPETLFFSLEQGYFPDKKENLIIKALLGRKDLPAIIFMTLSTTCDKMMRKLFRNHFNLIEGSYKTIEGSATFIKQASLFPEETRKKLFYKFIANNPVANTNILLLNWAIKEKQRKFAGYVMMNLSENNPVDHLKASIGNGKKPLFQVLMELSWEKEIVGFVSYKTIIKEFELSGISRQKIINAALKLQIKSAKSNYQNKEFADSAKKINDTIYANNSVLNELQIRFDDDFNADLLMLVSKALKNPCDEKLLDDIDAMVWKSEILIENYFNQQTIQYNNITLILLYLAWSFLVVEAFNFSGPIDYLLLKSLFALFTFIVPMTVEDDISEWKIHKAPPYLQLGIFADSAREISRQINPSFPEDSASKDFQKTSSYSNQ